MVSGTAQSVALSASGAPAGVTVSFNPASVTAGGTSTMTVATTAAAATGTATITVSGASASATHTAGFALTVGGSGGGAVLLSQGKPATASSLESSSFPAGHAFDGNLTSTRWASKEGVDPQWLRVDLGASANLSRVKLTWEAAYAKACTIETSADSTTWTKIYSTTTGNGGTDDLTGLSATGRYVRITGTACLDHDREEQNGDRRFRWSPLRQPGEGLVARGGVEPSTPPTFRFSGLVNRVWRAR